jgi:adenylosuccinate synthase
LKDVAICTAYELVGKPIESFPGDSYLLERCKPIYEVLPGWSADLTNARRVSDLPNEARRYVERIRELIGVPVSYVSVGADREQTIAI